MPLSRIVSSVIAISLALGMIILGGWYFAFGIGILIVLSQLEYFRLVRAKGIEPAAKTTLVVSQLLLISSTLAPNVTDAMFLPGGNDYLFFICCFNLKWQRSPIFLVLY